MQIALIDHTGAGNPDPWYAARLLAYTKNTRLQMTPDGWSHFKNWSSEKLLEELTYMSSSIASSWEFCDLTFAINGISRACAQQMTRTRTASFAMQSQRVTNMSDVTFHIPETVPENALLDYKSIMRASLRGYQGLVKTHGTSLEDARGVLPINTHCNLIAKYNLRAWVDLVRARDSLRVQGEYRDVVAAMKVEVLKVWPWAQVFIEPKHQKAIAIIEEIAATLPSREQKVALAKAADLLKKETA